jgi:serine/threonine-protein kinase RsbW
MKGLRLPATLESLPGLQSFIRQELDHLRVAPGKVLEIEMVLEEIVTNIIRYAYPARKGEVEVGYSLEPPRRFCVVLKDWGECFNPLNYGPPNLSPELSQRPIGGLGIHLARQFSDRMEYECQGGANLVRVWFDLTPAPSGS